MAKDDYYFIAARILIYLYKKYKQMDVDKNYLHPMTKEFPICKEQLDETIVMLIDERYIIGKIHKPFKGMVLMVDYTSLKITPTGIEYLADNPKIRKVCDHIVEARDIYSVFNI